jgi:hypothetical protein
MGILCVLFGAMALAGGIFGKDFHTADVDALGEFKQKSPRWLGRLVFLTVGIGLIALGIKFLVSADCPLVSLRCSIP